MEMQLAEIGVRCDKCGTSFVSRQLPSFIDIGYRNSELRQDYRGYTPQMEQYCVVTCPSCGRAGWSTEFPPVEGTPVLLQATASAHMQYRQAALEKERSQDSVNSYQAAVFYVHAAWCADDSKAFPQAREYRRLASESYKRALSDGSCPLEVRAETEYLIGELLRRAGDFDGAREHFRMCIGRLAARYANMARKLMRLCDQGSTESIPFESDVASSAPPDISRAVAAPPSMVSAPQQMPPVGAPPGFTSGTSATGMPAMPPTQAKPPGAPSALPSGAPPSGSPPSGPPSGAPSGRPSSTQKPSAGGPPGFSRGLPPGSGPPGSSQGPPGSSQGPPSGPPPGPQTGPPSGGPPLA